ncbi:MAG TPA: choice-of-anchor V domain-containing protein [Pyrinomonadaceae bacterium]|nr:choice-of-anchor V domain-containing protein [Pyrinomonadaceae bacterium]
MKIVSRKMFFTKLSVIFAVAGFVFAVQMFSTRVEKTSASAFGPSASHTNAPGEDTCAACHSEFPVNSGTGSVSITGVPANYVPNKQYQITVRTSQIGATIYGFQMTAIDPLGKQTGTYTLPTQNPERMQLINGLVDGNVRQYVEHTVDGIIPAQFDFNTWTFTWTAPNRRVGKISFYAAGNSSNSDGQTSGDYIYTTSQAALSGTANANFDADGKSDFSVWRPSTGVWYALNSTNGGFQALQFGSNGDRIAPGDYDGDGKTDFAVFRPSTGVWYIQKSNGSGYIITQFGSNGDIPVVGDYDADGKSDIAVWRPSTGVWYIFRSSDLTYDIRQFGLSTDKIAQGDYDADGKTDLAVFRPSSGDWYVWKSTDNSFITFHFGSNGDLPVQADYDGDGKHDFAVFRPSQGVWYVQRSTAGFGSVQFGANGDKPVPTDYDGDGLADFAVYRNGIWFALRSTDLGVSIGNFGLAGDVPIPSGYLAE